MGCAQGSVLRIELSGWAQIPKEQEQNTFRVEKKQRVLQHVKDYQNLW